MLNKISFLSSGEVMAMVRYLYWR